MNLGAHFSIAGGFDQAVARALEEGANTLQVFTRNQKQWRASPLDPVEVEAFRRARAEAGLGGAIAHASYLVNLASPDDALRARSIEGLRVDYERAEALGLDAVVFHPGAHKGSGIDEGLNRIAAGVREVLTGTPGFRCRLAFETTAGTGTQLGARLEEIARLLATSGPMERLGVCLDTCHLFAAGYDLRTAAAYRSTRRLIDSIVGLDHVVAIHVNDSKAPLGSHRDRHEHIGRGAIGEEGFRALVRDERFAHLPMVLETAKGTHEGRSWDRINLETLRNLRRG